MIPVDIVLMYPPGLKLNYQLSIPQLSAYLKQHGVKVGVIDSPAYNLGIKSILKHLEDYHTQAFGISIPFTPYAKSGINLIKALKDEYPEIPIIVGGVHPTLCPEEFENLGAIVVKGEGEHSLLNILKTSDVKPPAFNDLPFPDWECVPIEKYEMRLPTGEKAMPIRMSTGCPFNCNFCSNRKLSNGIVRYRKVDKVVEEIKLYKKKYEINHFVFRDENFTLNKEHVHQFCKKLIREEVNIKFWIQTRANLLSEFLLGILKEAGCIGVSIGVETGDPYVLEKIQKGVTLEHIEGAFNMIHNSGLYSCANFIIGHPWETLKTANNTIEFAAKLNPHFIGFGFATPYPGTDLRELAIEEGTRLSEYWEEYRTGQVTYIPPGLRSEPENYLSGRIAMHMIKDDAERRFYLLSWSKWLWNFNMRRGWRNKARFIRKTMRWIL